MVIEHCLGIGKHWPHVVFGVGAVVLAYTAVWSLPLRSALEIGGDEHFELTKALLWAKGFPLYDKIWSDQPPVYTVILGTLFRFFGPTIGVARGLALGFGLLLVTGCFVLVNRRHGLLAACVATVCLLAFQSV